MAKNQILIRNECKEGVVSVWEEVKHSIIKEKAMKASLQNMQQMILKGKTKAK